MTFYKIRSKTNGLFSTGGLTPYWSKAGKTWSKLCYVKSHLKQHYEYRSSISVASNKQKQISDEYLGDIEVVEFSTNGPNVIPTPK